MLVSHNLSLVQSLCKRVMLLDKGEIQKQGPTEEVIPFYQDAVLREQEKELSKKMISKSDKVRIDLKPVVDISSVSLFDRSNQVKNEFKTNEALAIGIEYNAYEKIEDPIIVVDIVRSDEVLCCSFSSEDDDNFPISYLSGKGRIRLDVGKIQLAPSLYMVRIIFYDRDRIHSYAYRKQDFFRIESDDPKEQITNAIFLTSASWSKKE